MGLFLDVKGGFANSVFKIVFTPLRAYLKLGFFATQLCIRSGVVSWMPFSSSSSNVPSCDCSLIRFPLVLPCAGQVNNGWTGKVSWFWSRAGGQRVGILIQRPGFFCWRVKPLDVGGKAEIQGPGLVREIISYICIKKTV